MKELAFFLKFLSCLYLLFVIKACIKEPTPPLPETEEWLLSKIVNRPGSFQEYKYNAYNKPVSKYYYLKDAVYLKDTFIYNASQQLINMMSFGGSMTTPSVTFSYKYDMQGRMIEEFRTSIWWPDSRKYTIYRGNTIVDSICTFDEFGNPVCDWKGDEHVYDNAGNLIKSLLHYSSENPDHCCDDTVHLTGTVEYSQYDNHPNPFYLTNLPITPTSNSWGHKLSVNNPGMIKEVLEDFDWGTGERFININTYTSSYIYNNEGLVIGNTSSISPSDTARYEYIRRQ